MKRTITILAMIISILSFSQETEFKFTKDGFTDYLVIPCEGKTQTELYKKAIDWVNVTFNNPKEVIKAQIENDYIRIEGTTKELICFNSMGKRFYDSNYLIEISLKENKYKFDVISITMLNTKSEPNIQLLNMSEYFKDDGSIRGMYKFYPEIIPQYFNNLNKSLNDFIVNGATTKKKNDW